MRSFRLEAQIGGVNIDRYKIDFNDDQVDDVDTVVKSGVKQISQQIEIVAIEVDEVGNDLSNVT